MSVAMSSSESVCHEWEARARQQLDGGDATQWARRLEHRDMQPQRGKQTDKTSFDDDGCVSDVERDQRGSLVVGGCNTLQESRLFCS